MQVQHKDIAVIGGGAVGLVTALLAAQQGLSVVVIDAAAPPDFNIDAPFEARTIALNHVSLQLLEQLGCWAWLAQARVAAMDSMLIQDAQAHHFSIQQQTQQPLAVVVEYRHLQWALYQACLQQPLIDTLFDTTAQSLQQDAASVSLRLASADYIVAKLAVGADGVNSWLAHHVAQPVVEQDYGHIACIGLAQCTQPRRYQAVQTCGDDYICGMLPTPTADTYSIIYACTQPCVDSLLAADKAKQDAQLTLISQRLLGDMHWQGNITTIALLRRHLTQYHQQRVVFIGDAAHRVHPLAGQGANMGFADAKALVACLRQAQQEGLDLGSRRVLQQFELAQKPKNQLLLSLHDVLKFGLTAQASWAKLARRFGFGAIRQSDLIQRVLQSVVN